MMERRVAEYRESVLLYCSHFAQSMLRYYYLNVRKGDTACRTSLRRFEAFLQVSEILYRKKLGSSH